MKAESNDDPILEYIESDWGDWICGTKEQLQALGLGVGLAYPGEPGGPRREMTVRDPRGYRATISNWRHDDDHRFSAHIHFPNWPARPAFSEWKLAFPGVKRREYAYFDEYIGSAEALASAGLVRADQLPGQPGMRKVRVTIFPDGTLPSGAPTAVRREARMPGARSIDRASASTYRVRVNVSDDEEQRRRAAEELAEAAWRQQVRALPRPPRLGARVRSEAPPNVARRHLRLVWSAPA